MKRDRDLRVGSVLVLVLASLPWWALTNPYYMGIGITALTFVALALAWNIISGIGGQLSLGHGAYFGLGAYTSTLLLVRLGVTPWIGMIAGALVAAGLEEIAADKDRLRADYAIRLGGPSPQRGFLPVPGGGPLLTWKAIHERAMPPLPNWNLQMGDIALF